MAAPTLLRLLALTLTVSRFVMAALRPLSRSFESSLDLLNIAVLEIYSVLFGPLEHGRS